MLSCVHLTIRQIPFGLSNGVCVCVFIAFSFECLPTVCVVCSFKMNWCRAIRRSHTRLLLSLVFTSHTQYDVNKLESKCVLNMRYTVTLFNLLFSFHSISLNSEKPFEVDYIVCTMDVRERFWNDLVPFCWKQQINKYIYVQH